MKGPLVGGSDGGVDGERTLGLDPLFCRRPSSLVNTKGLSLPLWHSTLCSIGLALVETLNRNVLCSQRLRGSSYWGPHVACDI